MASLQGINKFALAVCSAILSLGAYAATPEGYWRVIDDQTGQSLSVIQITKNANQNYDGKIVYRYPNNTGYTLKVCNKCQGSNKGKPIIGMTVLHDMKQSPSDPNKYIDGTLLDVRNGNTYRGKAALSPDGNRLMLRGYIGISAFGRKIVFLRTSAPSLGTL